MPILFRRHATRYGEILHKVIGPRKDMHLLITEGGKKLLLSYRKILQSVKVQAVGSTDEVTFSRNLRPNLVGAGGHALIYVLRPSKEVPFIVKSGANGTPLRTLILKVYRKSVPTEKMPGGFTQFVAQMAIYNYLKRQLRPTFVVRPVPFYFVSDELFVREFIRAPTLEELKESLVDTKVRRKPLSLALSDQEIDDFVKKNRITPKFLGAVEHDLLSALQEGERVQYHTKLPIIHDPTIKNFFILGRDAKGKAIINVIDQGRVPIAGLSEAIKKGLIF